MTPKGYVYIGTNEMYVVNEIVLGKNILDGHGTNDDYVPELGDIERQYF